MVLDLAFNYFGHQTVDGATTGRYLLQNRGAVPIFLNGAFNSVELSLDAIDACNELSLPSRDVTQFAVTSCQKAGLTSDQNL